MAEFEQDQVQHNPVGDRLRAAREAKGLGLDDVARQTRIPIRHLQHIERGEWDALPAVTYSVGFARNYANIVGLDGAQIGAELREHLGASRRPASPAAAYYEPADPARVPPWSIALVAAVLAVLIVGGYLFWRSSAVDDSDAQEIAVVPVDQAEPGAPPPAAPAPAPTPATGPVVLTAVEDVWMRVTDGGQTLYEGILTAGQSYQVPQGAQTPSLRAGRGAALRVTVGNSQIPPLGGPSEVVSNISLRPADLAQRAQPQPSGPVAPAPAAAR